MRAARHGLHRSPSLFRPSAGRSALLVSVRASLHASTRAAAARGAWRCDARRAFFPPPTPLCCPHLFFLPVSSTSLPPTGTAAVRAGWPSPSLLSCAAVAAVGGSVQSLLSTRAHEKERAKLAFYEQKFIRTIEEHVSVLNRNVTAPTARLRAPL